MAPNDEPLTLESMLLFTVALYISLSSIVLLLIVGSLGCLVRFWHRLELISPLGSCHTIGYKTKFEIILNHSIHAVIQ